MAKKTFAELLAQANIFKIAKGRFSIKVELFFDFLMDIINKLKELSDRQAADLLGSVDLSGTPAVYPAAQRGWWKIETNVLAVDGGDLDGQTVKAGGQLVCDGTTFTYAEDPSFVTEIQDRIDADNDIYNKISVPPEYTAPTYSTLNLSPSLAEVGENVYPVLSMASFVQNDGGVPDKEAAVVKVDGVTQVKDTNYEIDGDTITFLTPLQRTGLEEFNITVTIPYAQGPIKNDEVLGTPNDTGRIEAGSVTASANLYYENATWWITDNALFSEANSLRGGSKSFSNTINMTIPIGVKVVMFAIPNSRTVASIIDTTHLNANLTANYTLQPDTTMKDADNQDVTVKYYALVLSQGYDEITNHRLTIN